MSQFNISIKHLQGRVTLNLFRPITGTLHTIEIINKCRRRHQGGGGGWSRGRGGAGLVVVRGCCKLPTAGLLRWSFWGIGACVVNVLLLHIVLPLIHIITFLSIGVKKILHTIWYLCPCNETPKVMRKQFGKILLFNLSTGQHS